MISLKFNCIAGALLIGFLFIPATGAAEIETMGVFSNDSFFDSDGSGVTGSLELVTKTGPWYVGVAFYLVTPELLKEKRPNNDPLAELSRLNLWAGKDVKWFSKSDFHISGRVGLEGGVADDLGFQLQDVAHESLYDGLQQPFIGEFGILGQLTPYTVH